MKIKKIIISCLLLVVVLLLCSCEAVDELTGKGLWGWLGVDNPLDKEVDTKQPVPTFPSGVTMTEDVSTEIPTSTPIVPSVTELPVSTEEKKPPTYPTYQELLSNINAVNMNGASLMMACPVGSKVLTWQNAEMYNSIMSEVNKKANVNLVLNPQDGDKLEENLRNAVENNGYCADVLYLPLSVATRYAKEGLLAEIDPSKLSSVSGAYDVDLNSAVTMDGKLYGVASSSSASYENNVVIYLNTDLLKRLDIEFDSYKAVENNEWTWEMIYMLCSAAKLKNDGSFSISGSLWDANKTQALLYSSSGLQLTASDVYGDEKSKFQKDANTEFMAKLSVFMNSGNFISGDEASSAFYNGELLLLVGNVEELRKHYTSCDSFAILPLPKVDSLQGDYVTVCDPDETYVYAFPKNGENFDRVLYLVDLMSCVSRYCFKNDFIESLYSIYIRQSDSIAMLGIDKNNRFIPRVLTFGDKELLDDIISEF